MKLPKLLDYKYSCFTTVRKIALWLATAILIATLFFAYTSNIEIDAATEETYHTLDVLAVVFYCLAPLAVAIFVVYAILFVKKRKEKRRSRHRKMHIHTFDVLNFAWMAIFCLLCIYPLIYVFVGSFNQGADYAKGGVYLLPRLFTFENYKVVLEDEQMWHSYVVTFARTILGTLSGLVFTSAVAYAMSRENLKFKKGFYWLNIVTMFFGGGLIPYFLIIVSVGLYNSFWVYIIPALYSVYNMIVISSFFRGISSELHEAAMVDGASEFRIWWQIYMPLSKPVLATVALWLAVGHWNNYFDTMMYTNSDELQTLQHYLYEAIKQSTVTEGMSEAMLSRISPMTVSLAAIIVSIVPVLFFFPFVRKNFQSGIMIGSLKG